MNNNLLDRIKLIVAEKGEKALTDSGLFSNCLADLARDEPKPQKTALIKCVEHNFVRILKDAEESDRDNRKGHLAQRLNEEEGLDLKLCEEAVNLLAAVLFENKGITEEPMRQPSTEKDIAIAELEVELGALQVAYKKLQADYGRLQIAYDALNTGKQKPSKNLPKFQITSLKLGNFDVDYRWLTTPGGRLSASNIRIFTPVITYDSVMDEPDVEFYVKIIDQAGRLQRDPRISPAGYTYCFNTKITCGTNQKLKFDGWGDPFHSIYHAGLWTVEVWRGGVGLISQQVRIN
ncbi:MAG: hypothetical protein FWD94_02320 [Treponema sp.]|nr:hypothetical protein [Treponema sp.]